MKSQHSLLRSKQTDISSALNESKLESESNKSLCSSDFSSGALCGMKSAFAIQNSVNRQSSVRILLRNQKYQRPSDLNLIVQ